ncbi:MAG: ATP-binding cassette domain-containing protein [Clostridia bacterium]|nr:ATP-binding cassette domain-containing protein [Clostridia bacterium]MDD4376045.1 ATP-binding cassette domain-containing protein [Clostridia bacterium]
MLELKNIRKTYILGEFKTKALDDISVAFRKKEFVAILGPSGSGKTTCLNIVGGLDRYDSGELIIKGKKTSDFKEKEWDAYRNNSIGFVFQNYNLIHHLDIVSNVEMSLTLSGVSSKEKKKKAIEALKKVGLEAHLHKNPNQLSGGQMQRVAIARALVNDPEILMCDEPTGSLDTVTSVQIMDLIKEVAKDKLVIMVTHNPELAEKYANRIIRFKDGKIESDTNSYEPNKKVKDEFELNKTKMSFITALKLSFNNIKTKKGRTFLTAFASSIGIIGIAIILSLSTGFQTKIDEYIDEAMEQFPIIISQTAMEINEEEMKKHRKEMLDTFGKNVNFSDSKELFLYESKENAIIHTNVISEEYINYLNNIDTEIASSMASTYMTGINILTKNADDIKPAGIAIGAKTNMNGMGTSGMANMNLTTYPNSLGERDSYLEQNYDVLEGGYPESDTDLVLVVSAKNKVDKDTMKSIGFSTDGIESISFKDIVGKEYRRISNDDYYKKTSLGTYVPGTDYKKMYEEENSITLKIVGVVRPKEDTTISLLAEGIAYSSKLAESIMDKEKDSEIVKAQRSVNYNIITKQEFKEGEKTTMLAHLGDKSMPVLILVYPTDFSGKDKIINYLDTYNDKMEDKEKIIYNDLSSTITTMTSGIMDGITVVLIAFAAISLVVSLIMICIITYISVIERTKEIGILKALGARKKDITRVFNAETFILGTFSGILGVFIAWLLAFPINRVIYKLTDLEQVANLKLIHAVILIAISTMITIIGGYIPAIIASKKEAVDALRTE